MNYGRTLKDVVFRETDKRHADLKIRLAHDGLTQQKFFSSLISAYLERNDDVMKFVFDLKDREKIQTIQKRKRIKKMHEKIRETETKFGLDKEEIECIFDLISGVEGEDV